MKKWGFRWRNFIWINVLLFAMLGCVACRQKETAIKETAVHETVGNDGLQEQTKDADNTEYEEIEEKLPEKELTLNNLQEEVLKNIELRQETATWEFLIGDMTDEEVNAVFDELENWDNLLLRYYVSSIRFEQVQEIKAEIPYTVIDVVFEYYDDCVDIDDFYHVYDIEDVYNAFADNLQTGFEETVLYIHGDIQRGDECITEPWNLAYYGDQISWDYAVQMPYVFRQIMHSLYEEENGDCLLVVTQEYDVYNLTKEQQIEAQKLVAVEVEKLAEQVKAYSESKDEQSRYLYKLITEKVDFDYDVSDALLDAYNATDPEISTDRGIYGALLEGESVCSGYAAAYKAVCDELDIPCKVLLGYAENGDHAWNMIIKEDGSIAYVDPTWGDSAKWYSTYYDMDDAVIRTENRRIYDYLYIPQEFMDAGFDLERAPQFLYDDVE